eukprot:888964-Prorocentrum_minimum.AAC.3
MQENSYLHCERVGFDSAWGTARGQFDSARGFGPQTCVLFRRGTVSDRRAHAPELQFGRGYLRRWVNTGTMSLKRVSLDEGGIVV